MTSNSNVELGNKEKSSFVRKFVLGAQNETGKVTPRIL